MKGSFLTEDSYFGDIRNPLTLNRYSYCIGNPLYYSDPSGHWGINGILNCGIDAGKSKKEELLRPKRSGIAIPKPYRNEKLKERIGNATENGKSKNCNESVAESIKNISGYLEGKVGKEDAEKSIENLAKTGAFYNGIYVTSVKSYKSDYEDKNYDRFDTQIIGWVAYYNYINPDYKIDPEWVKAMICAETRYGYLTDNSPNANASRDIMQTLDPRNPTLFDYISEDLNLDIAMVIGPVDIEEEEDEVPVKAQKELDRIIANREKEEEGKKLVWMTVNRLRKINKSGPISQESMGHDPIPVVETIFSKEDDDKYYYMYSSVTPFMSLGVGIHTLQKKYESLGSSATPDDIIRAYNAKDDGEEYLEEVNYLLNLKVQEGWESEYDATYHS